MIPTPVTAIEQKRLGRGRQRFELVDAEFLSCTFKTFRVQRRHRIELGSLDAEPVRYKFVPLGSSIASLVFGLFTAWGLLALRAAGGIASDPGLWVIPIFFGTATVACFYKFLQDKTDQLTFCSRYNEQDILTLWWNRPDPATFEAFVETLKKRILEANRSHPTPGSSASLAQEILELKKLVDTGDLTKDEFERAKARLLSEQPPRTIGFNQ
jgi:hypothetical protein